MSTIQQRWAAKLIGLKYRIEYKHGADNKVAYALSRRSHGEELSQFALLAPVTLDKSALKEEIRADKELGQLHRDLEQDNSTNSDFTLVDGLLYRKGCLVIHVGSPFIPKLLEQFHTSALGGHEGALKTFKRLTNEVYWRGMRKVVVKFIFGCQVCQKNKYSILSLACLLYPLLIPQQI